MSDEHPDRPWRVEAQHVLAGPEGEVGEATWVPVDRSRFASKEAAEAHMESIATLDSSALRVERAVHFEAST